MPSVGWWGTGPFFGEKTYFPDKRLAENMDLSPSRDAVPCSHPILSGLPYSRQPIISDTGC